MSMTETCIMDGMTSAKFFDTMGKRIRILREDQGLNQTELAQRMAQCGGGVDPSYLSQMESDAKLPRLPVFVAIVRALGTTADYLLLLSDDPQPAQPAQVEACGSKIKLLSQWSGSSGDAARI